MHPGFAVLSNVALLFDSLLVGIVFFTLLPLSVAILTLPLNAIMFVMCRRRLTWESYLVVIHGIAFGLSIIIFILIAGLGRDHFRFLLDWSWMHG